EVPVYADPGRAGVPVVAEVVEEGVAVARPGHEAAGLVADGVVRGVGEGTERMIGDVGSVRVDVVLGAGSAVLQVVTPAVLCHPRAFDVGIARVRVVLPEPFPSVPLRVQTEEPHDGVAVHRARGGIDLGAKERLVVRRAPVHVPPGGVGVAEEVATRGARRDRVGSRLLRAEGRLRTGWWRKPAMIEPEPAGRG